MHCNCIKKIEEIAEKNNIEDMRKLSHMLCESMEKIKNTDTKEYNKQYFMLHEMLHGEILTMELAEWWVNIMEPKAKWTVEQTKSVLTGQGITEANGYAIMNMLYSDASSMFGTGDTSDSINEYIKATKNWLEDKDIGTCKAYRYFKCVVLGY